MELPTVSIVGRDAHQHRWARADRDSHSDMKAVYTDVKRGTHSTVLAGTSGRTKTLRQTVTSQADALIAARAKWLRINAASTLSTSPLPTDTPTSCYSGPS